MTEYKAIFFDLDGTILDSKRSVIEAVCYIAKKYSPNKFTYKDIEDRFGESLDEFIDNIGSGNREIIFEDYMKYITKYHDELVTIFPNVKQNLKILKAEGYKLAITTNKQKQLTYKGLKLFKIMDLFDEVITLEDVSRGKPDSEMINLACRNLNIDKEDVIMVGDSMFDIQAAKSANIKIAIINWYMDFNINSNKNIKPDYVFDNFDEFLIKTLNINFREVLRIG